MKRRVYEHRIKVREQKILKALKRGKHTEEIQMLIEAIQKIAETLRDAVSIFANDAALALTEFAAETGDNNATDACND